MSNGTNIPAYLEALPPDQRTMLEEAPRQNRLPLLAQAIRKPEADVLRSIAKAEGMDVLEDFELPDDAAEILPLRLMHEYQCLPFTEEGTGPDVLPLVTVWPPTAEMSEWISAVSSKEPRWHLGPATRISETITQRYGVGADSLFESDIATEDSGRLE